MLTKTDLSQIKKLVREEVEAEGENTRSEIMSEIKLAGMRTATELREVNTRLKNLEIKTMRIEKDVKKVQRDLRKTSDFLDRENLKTVKRVQKIEEHLDFPEPAII